MVKSKFIKIKSTLFLLVCGTLLPFFFPKNNDDTLIYIPKGSTAYVLGDILKENGLIYSKNITIYFMRFTGKDKQIKPGEFFIPANSSLFSLVNYITDNNNIFYRKVTIIEGSTLKQALAIIENVEELSGDISIRLSEGEIMPDTYHFIKGDTRDSLIKRMNVSMISYLGNLWETRDKNLPYKTPYEALIMASLIEKEATMKEERDIIASVFINRIRLGMRLQTDPTVAYGLGRDNADGLTRSDLLSQTPYNTYVINGLPPTPIASPSRESLIAAFNPANTSYLYFVANGRGGHAFAKNLVDHNKNVAVWREIERRIKSQR